MKRKTKAVLAAEERFQLLAYVAVRALGGAHVREDADTLVFQTTAGALRITPRGDAIFCRFEDVARAVQAHVGRWTSFNPCSGKWNWHFGAGAGVVEVLHFADALRCLLPKEGS